MIVLEGPLENSFHQIDSNLKILFGAFQKGSTSLIGKWNNKFFVYQKISKIMLENLTSEKFKPAALKSGLWRFPQKKLFQHIMKQQALKEWIYNVWRKSTESFGAISVFASTTGKRIWDELFIQPKTPKFLPCYFFTFQKSLWESNESQRILKEAHSITIHQARSFLQSSTHWEWPLFLNQMVASTQVVERNYFVSPLPWINWDSSSGPLQLLKALCLLKETPSWIFTQLSLSKHWTFSSQQRLEETHFFTRFELEIDLEFQDSQFWTWISQSEFDWACKFTKPKLQLWFFSSDYW